MRMSPLLTPLLLFTCLSPSFSGEVKYPVSAIDTALLRNAAMVVRTDETTLEIRSNNLEVVKVHYVLTILNASAAENAVFKAFYDKFITVNEFKGSMYDGSGKLIRNFNSKDISDESAIPSGILYTDDRVKYFRPVLGFYPVTLEFFSEQTIKRILFYPAIRPQDDFEQAIEYASFEVLAPDSLFPRFKELRIPANTITQGDGITHKKWEFHNLLPKIREPFSPSLEALTPVIYLSPVSYTIKGYQGDFTTWEKYGAWIKSLNAGRDSLPADVANRVRQLVEGVSMPLEKVKKIYHHMQQTTRYVAVELGIGGLQPETADMVCRMGYGDCKGLVNYTAAMLKCIGIQSYAVLIRAGAEAEPLESDSPGNQFNHVILCVPLGKDTTWLECTSQRIPFGYLGSFTNNRAGLMIGPEGGKIVRTPAYGRNENTCQRKTTITIDSAGSAVVDMHTSSRGLFYDNLTYMLRHPRDKQMERLTENYHLPGLKMVTYTCESDDEKIPTVTENLHLIVSGFASVNGTRIFITPTVLLTTQEVEPDDGTRNYDLVIPHAYVCTDTIVLRLPQGYHIESSPSTFDLQSAFGGLTTTIIPQNGVITYIRMSEQKKGWFPANNFGEFAEFSKKMYKQDHKKLVIVRN